MKYEHEATRVAVVIKLTINQGIATMSALVFWAIFAKVQPVGDVLIGAVIAFAISTAITGYHAHRAQGKHVDLIVDEK
ncbi:MULTISPECIES: hypothetical protein [Pseudomonas]|uniref:Holin n=1 Tax=Pseudomonas baetica TaxID=674054 RepID=A0ABX4Q7S6_9PSED|nr:MULTISPECIES: hypothetical protein [Pseudomonas]MDR9862297.1 hypothetical protein [Pseudomonas baetica]PKA72781.1 hypothetical protein ATI02_5871 [Pseudomonas baetica]PTC16799.1 hypothetical protein C0J26_22770 [Pseudomonas baetica]